MKYFYVCKYCGASYEDTKPEVCEQCGAPTEDMEVNAYKESKDRAAEQANRTLRTFIRMIVLILMVLIWLIPSLLVFLSGSVLDTFIK